MDAGEHGRRIVAVLHLRAVRRSIDLHMAVVSHRMAVLHARHLAAILVPQELHIQPMLRAPHHLAALPRAVHFISQAVLAIRAGRDQVLLVRAVIHGGRKNFTILLLLI